jgi:small subunit ribosomal protein S5
MAFNQENNNAGFVDKLVGVNRVAKVVKGGRRFSFSAIVVVGDENGRVGWGSGKAKEVPEAIRKATDVAKKSMVRVPMRDGRTLHHDIVGDFGASKVMLRSAQPGRGIIAGGPMRAIFEAVGIKDVVTKSLGSNNPYNMIQATFAAFANLQTPRGVASKRGKKVSDFKRFREQTEAQRVATPEAATPAVETAKKPAAKTAAKKAPAGKASTEKKAAPKKETTQKEETK